MAANIISCPETSWQSSLVGPREKLNSLFYNENFSDLIISFPGQDIRYKAHRLIMALSSSVFEGMLFGPLAIKGSKLELHDDNPEAFKRVLNSCYEVNIELSDIDMALEVYMLADKYLMEQLRKECLLHIVKLINSENINKLLEFATHFNFNSLKATCFQTLEAMFQMDANCSSDILLVLQKDWLHELLESGIEISQLVFQDSWKNPDKKMPEDFVLKILKSDCCCYPGLGKFFGCVSAKAVSNICWDLSVTEEPADLCLSFTTHEQAKEVISVLYDINYTQHLSVHLQCSMIPADLLTELPLKQLKYMLDIFISDVDDNGIEWVVSALGNLIPNYSFISSINFPKSKLTLNGLTTILSQLRPENFIICSSIRICSLELPLYKEEEVKEWLRISNTLHRSGDMITLFDINEDMPGW